jgi:DNA invertase Pin-like site-specific DNA recombinase
MKAKYIRVSTIEQNTARQEKNSNEFSKIYLDKVSGAIPFSERKEASKLISDINAKIINEVHVCSIDRLGRNILDILTIINFFDKNEVNVYVESIGMFSRTNNSPNDCFKMVVSVLGNVAEMERNAMLERQKQGIQIAKANGTYKGRLLGSKMTDEQILEKYKKVVKELKGGESLRRSASIAGCSLGTAQRIQAILQKKSENVNQ